MRTDKSEVKSTVVNADGTYEVDAFKMVVDPETGVKEGKRWVEKRPITVGLQTVNGKVFHKGARIA